VAVPFLLFRLTFPSVKAFVGSKTAVMFTLRSDGQPLECAACICSRWSLGSG
jgi:hypothetical protein